MAAPGRGGYVDLCVNVARLKGGEAAAACVRTLLELGYAGCALNTEVYGDVQDKHRCVLDRAALLRPWEEAGGALGIVPRLYTRITCVVETEAEARTLDHGSAALDSYEIVAARPTADDAFDFCCKRAQVDVISLDLCNRLSFHLHPTTVAAALARGVFFEVCYAPALDHAVRRRRLVANVAELVRATRGRNLIFSSGASDSWALRGPLDVVNLAGLLGLPSPSLEAILGKNARQVLLHGLSRHGRHRGIHLVSVAPAAPAAAAPRGPAPAEAAAGGQVGAGEEEDVRVGGGGAVAPLEEQDDSGGLGDGFISFGTEPAEEDGAKPKPAAKPRVKAGGILAGLLAKKKRKAPGAQAGASQTSLGLGLGSAKKKKKKPRKG
uniref:Uncharacterized protein n=1 Tax=Phaeomonas parva TaxID=124430 RepID=A0A7S1U7N7_9STRA